MRKRIEAFLLILSAALLLLLSGCSKSGDYMSREEWISVLTLKFGMYTYESDSSYYSDVKDSSEYFAGIQIAREWDVISDADQFKPGDPVTRGFIAETLARTIRMQGVAETSISDAGDYDSNLLGLVVDYDIFTISGEKFNPDTNMTQAECEEALEKGYDLWLNHSYEEEYIEITYQEGVIVLDELEGFEPEAELLEGEIGEPDAVLGIRMSEEEAAELTEGSIYTIPATGISDSVQYLKVSAIEAAEEAGMVQVISTQAELEEVFEEIYLEGDYEPDYTDFIPGQGVTATYLTTSAGGNTSNGNNGLNINAGKRSYDVSGLVSTNGPEINHNLVNNKIVIQTEPEGLQLEVDFGDGIKYKFTLSDIYCAIMIDYSGWKINSTSAKVNFQVNNVFGTEGTVKQEFSKTLGVLPVPIALGFTGNIEIKATLSIEGEFSVSLGCSGTYGVEVINNNVRVIKDLAVNREIFLYASIGAMADINLNITWFGFKPRLLAVGTEIGPKGEISSELLSGCVDINGAILWNLYYLSDIKIGKLELNEKIPIWDMDSSRYKLHYHVEDGRLVEVCTRTGRNAGNEADSGENSADSGAGAGGRGNGSEGTDQVLIDRDMNTSDSYSMFLQVGQSGVINVSAGDDYTFESENNNVATVTAAGKVTGAATGNTIINIYKSDGTRAVSVSVTVD